MARRFRKKHKNAYYRFRNTAISLKSARLSFIKRKQILMYFYTRPRVSFCQPPPRPPPPPPTLSDAADAKLQSVVRAGVEAKSNYFYSGEMSAAKSLILINGPDPDQPASARTGSGVPQELPITQTARNDFIAKNLRFATGRAASPRIRIVRETPAPISNVYCCISNDQPNALLALLPRTVYFFRASHWPFVFTARIPRIRRGG